MLVKLSPHPGVESGVMGVYGHPIHKVGNGVGNVGPAGGVRDVGCRDAMQIGELKGVPPLGRTD